MTPKRILWVVVLVSFFIPSSSLLAQGVPTEVREKIVAANKEIEKAALAGEFARQFDFFTDDAILDHPFEPPLKGRSELTSAADRVRKAGMKYQSLGGSIEDMWMCGDKVYERGTWAMSSVTKDRRHPIAAYGSYFQIWRKLSSGELKVEYLIYTLDFNPYELGK